jgi:phospholipase/lecithinase/hemolysin
LSERLARAAADHPAARILGFDLHAAFGSAVAEAVSTGRNISDACFDSEAYFSTWLAPRRFHEQCEPAQDAAPRFDAFVFWDGIHPTGVVHAALGTAMAAAFDPAFDPEPGTPPLQPLSKR